jgi:hypothetical protein
VLSGDMLGALITIETALVGSIVAVDEPTLAAIIERRQRYLAVSPAQQVAVPEAFVDVVGSVGRGLDELARAVITVGQDLVDAMLSFSPGGVATALVNGITLCSGRRLAMALAAKHDAPPTADKPDRPTAKGPEHDTEKERGNSRKHETKNADNESRSEGANEKKRSSLLTRRPSVPAR